MRRWLWENRQKEGGHDLAYSPPLNETDEHAQERNARVCNQFEKNEEHANAKAKANANAAADKEKSLEELRAQPILDHTKMLKVILQ